MAGMKWTRAVHHLETLAETCADMATRPASIYTLRVTELWAFGDILGEPQDLEWVTVALGVDVPPEEVAWLTVPNGAEHWSNATRLSKNPVSPRWRSQHAPVWNHRITRPVLIWDLADGVRADALDALREGDSEPVRPPAPSEDEFRARIADEVRISLDTLRAATGTYADRRWAPGKIWPIADALWHASEGYLDLLDAS